MRILVAVFALLISLASCHSGANSSQKAAENSVVQFRTAFESEQYHNMYTEADEGLHQLTGEPDFVAYMQAVHRRLGRFQRSRLAKYQVGWFAGQGTRVNLVYDSTFANGGGIEEFVWHIRDGRALLFGYRVRSKDVVK